MNTPETAPKQQTIPQICRGYLPEYLELLTDTEICHSEIDPDQPAHASMVECNFGGLLIFLMNDEAVICWRDWTCDTVSVPEICEIEHVTDPESEDEDSDLIPVFNWQGTQYRLDEFMII